MKQTGIHGLSLTLALLASGIASAQGVTTYQQLQVRYRCPIVDRLERIYAVGDPAVHQDAYLIVDMPPGPETYVQCIFYRTDKIMCEAASGFYVAAPRRPRTTHLPAGAVAALGRLGFSTDDSQGNFRIDLDVADPPDFGAVADLILRALHDGYGARAETKLDFHAPYAQRGTTKCTPVS
jgi:hypothetical protein